MGALEKMSFGLKGRNHKKRNSIGETMKKVGLLIVLALALAAGFAQTQPQRFYATYGLYRGLNVHSLAYDGTPIIGINMGNIQKVGVDSWTHESSFRAVDWPTGTSGIDLGKYIGFEMTAVDGYKFTVDKITFGISRDSEGTLYTEWRGSKDDYVTSFTNYTSVPSGLSVDGTTGVITNPDSYGDSNWDPITITLDSNYQNITTNCGFRMYMYGAEAVGGGSGMYQDFIVEGTFEPISSGTDPVFAVTPSSVGGFSYVVGKGPVLDFDYKLITVGGFNLSGYTVTVSPDSKFEIAYGGSFANDPVTLALDQDNNMHETIAVIMKKGLPEGIHNGQITVEFASANGSIYEYISLNGTVTPSPPLLYGVDFEGTLETKTLYKRGPVYLSGLEWILDGVLIGTGVNERISGERSARLRGTDAASSMTMKEFKTCGAGEISFDYRSYDTGSQATWEVGYCKDSFSSPYQTWTPIKTLTTPTTSVQRFSHELNIRDDVRICIKRVSGTGSDIIVDNIEIKDCCDFYNGTPETVGTGNQNTITIRGGNGNYGNSQLNDVPLPGLTSTFHRWINLMGGGAWTIETTVINPDPDLTYWTAYQENNSWHTVKMTDDTASILIDSSKAGQGPHPIELAIGYTNDPTLPVTLSHFSATMTAQNYVNLTWVSQTESNLMGYNVLRSVSEELSTASQICALIPATNSSEAQTYTYLDKELVEDGTYYYWLQSVDMCGTTGFYGPASVIFSITGDTGTPAIPTVTQLEDAYPNPFNPNTTLRYQLKDAGNVKIDIYNQRGQLVRSFVKSHDAAGYYNILWDGCDDSGNTLASGVYLYRMTSGKYSGVKKLVLQK